MIPFIDLKAQNNALRPELEAALARVLESGAFVLGPEVETFEQRFAEFCGVQHAVAVASGTAALQLALAALDVGRGDEVVVPALSFIATSMAVRYHGARPVFADIAPDTCTLAPESVRAVLSPRTRAILPVHLFGQTADVNALGALAAEQGAALVEDAAQAHGAEHDGRRAGALGNAGCFSFYPTKNLGALGEGGLISTNDSALAARARRLRDWGQREKYVHEELAWNARMEGFQGAVLNVKLAHLPRWNEARRAHAARYDALLPEIGIAPPVCAPGRRHVYHVYNVRVPERERVREELARAGIGTGIVYPRPLHLQPAHKELGLGPGAFPEAERAARELLALPMYPELSEDAPARVVEALGRALRAGA